jgi:hypothetical protein
MFWYGWIASGRVGRPRVILIVAARTHPLGDPTVARLVMGRPTAVFVTLIVILRGWFIRL